MVITSKRQLFYTRTDIRDAFILFQDNLEPVHEDNSKTIFKYTGTSVRRVRCCWMVTRGLNINSNVEETRVITLTYAIVV